jgi:Protein of unknown function (DUF3631)
MTEHTTLFDEVHSFLGENVVYRKPEYHIVQTLWIIGTGFVEFDQVSVFEYFPILNIRSPDEDNGKTRAMDIAELLSYNAISGGSYTAPALCDEIDRAWPQRITLILDELDETLNIDKDNSAYVRLLNNGYQRGKVIVRRNMYGPGNVATQAYCAKALAGLTLKKLKRTTRTRMLPIQMRPLREGETVAIHIDKVEGVKLRNRIDDFRPKVIQELIDIDEKSLSDLKVSRATNIWHPILALGKIGGDKWFEMATQACQSYITKERPKESDGKKVLLELYRVYVFGGHPKGIWSERFVDILKERGFSDWIDQYKVAEYLGEDGYGIETRDLRVGDKVRKAYHWDDAMEAFVDYLTAEQRQAINEEYSNRHNVATVADTTIKSKDCAASVPLF